MSAIERLRDGHYNSGVLSQANPGGLAGNGHVTNFPAACADIGQVAGDLAAAAALVTLAQPSAEAAQTARQAAEAAATEAAQFAASIDPARLDALERRAKFLFCLSVS